MQHAGATRPASNVAPTPARIGAGPFDHARYVLSLERSSPRGNTFVRAEDGTNLLFVESLRAGSRNLLALLAATASFAVVVVIAVLLCGWALTALDLHGSAKAAAAGGSLLLGVAAAFATVAVLAPKRLVSFYRDESKGELLLRVHQDGKAQVLKASYTVKDAAGTVLARLAKNHLDDAFCMRWACRTAGGALLCSIERDASGIPLWRRLLAPLCGWRRADFVFRSGERELGRLARGDGSVLDVSQDTERVLDRRVAVAIGFLLDTGALR